ncbi:hypothetical protein BC777_1726 [Yoonia maricola]|uniref:Uncharacterized protein n=1 Tax=Yoonia maricola TaxID=420999 RepID=A0A2M8WPL6_9RHOB|nr:hypothetical protein [Yoonia maricola]PJI92863.1 hypothetical protein BC777_1726 [Yoonia maricola]
MNSEDMINGIFRPLVGFFLGTALAYTFQLAQSAGWMFAVGWAVFLMLLFSLVLVLDRFLDWGFGRLTGFGLKKPMQPAKAETPHWFVRFGWVFGVIIGFSAVLLFPEEILGWL